MSHNKRAGQLRLLQGKPAVMTRAECRRRWQDPEWREQLSRARAGQVWSTADFRSVSSEVVGTAQFRSRSREGWTKLSQVMRLAISKRSFHCRIEV